MITCETTQSAIDQRNIAYFFERIFDDSPDKNSLAMIIFNSRLYFDIKSPPVIGCPTIEGHFTGLGLFLPIIFLSNNLILLISICAFTALAQLILLNKK